LLQGVVSGDASYWQSQWQRLKRMLFEAVLLVLDVLIVLTVAPSACLLQGVVSGDASYWQSQWQRLKRMMFEAVVEEPLVILVKLADRLHNMRTVYALAPAKQQAVAEETLAVWCSMAGSLGWHGLKVRTKVKNNSIVVYLLLQGPGLHRAVSGGVYVVQSWGGGAAWWVFLLVCTRWRLPSGRLSRRSRLRCGAAWLAHWAGMASR
jgi:hypothetical protein